MNLTADNEDGERDTPPSFTYTGIIKEGENKLCRTCLADIDGDGRGDYDLNNDVNWKVPFWRNRGTQDKIEVWQQFVYEKSVSLGCDVSE